jgi:hypothetical protein
MLGDDYLIWQVSERRNQFNSAMIAWKEGFKGKPAWGCHQLCAGTVAGR